MTTLNLAVTPEVSALNDTMYYTLENAFNSSAPPAADVGNPDVSTEALLRSNQLLSTIREVVRFFAVAVSVSGIVGNIINMVVLTRKWMRSSTNYYLTMLALHDTMYLFLSSLLLLKNFKQIEFNLVFCVFYPMAVSFTNYFSNTGTLLTLTFTAERYIAVRHPMKGRIICTTKRAKWIIAGVCSLSFCCGLPDFFTSKCVHNVINPETNRTYPPTHAGTESKDILQSLGYFWINPVIFTFIPLLLLAVFNSLLIYSVMQANKARKGMVNIDVTTTDARRERHQQEQQKITIMLISVVVVFFMCQLPSAIMMIVISSKRTETSQIIWNQYRVAGNFTNLLIQINAAINFILYSVFSTKFRKTFKRVFCCCLQRTGLSDGLFSENAAQQQTTNRPRAGSCIQINNVTKQPLNGRPDSTSSSLEHRTGKNGYLQIYGRQEDSV